VFDDHYDFCIKTMFGSSLPPVACRRAHVLFTYVHYLCLFVYSGVQHIVCCVFCFVCLRLCCSFSGLSILISPSVFSNVYLTD